MVIDQELESRKKVLEFMMRKEVSWKSEGPHIVVVRKKQQKDKNG